MSSRRQEHGVCRRVARRSARSVPGDELGDRRPLGCLRRARRGHRRRLRGRQRRWGASGRDGERSDDEHDQQLQEAAEQGTGLEQGPRVVSTPQFGRGGDGDGRRRPDQQRSGGSRQPGGARRHGKPDRDVDRVHRQPEARAFVDERQASARVEQVAERRRAAAGECRDGGAGSHPVGVGAWRRDVAAGDHGGARGSGTGGPAACVRRVTLARCVAHGVWGSAGRFCERRSSVTGVKTNPWNCAKYMSSGDTPSRVLAL